MGRRWINELYPGFIVNAVPSLLLQSIDGSLMEKDGARVASLMQSSVSRSAISSVWSRSFPSGACAPLGAEASPSQNGQSLCPVSPDRFQPRPWESTSLPFSRKHKQNGRATVSLRSPSNDWLHYRLPGKHKKQVIRLLFLFSNDFVSVDVK